MKHASKPKLRRNKHVLVNKVTGISENRQPRCGQSDIDHSDKLNFSRSE